MLKNVVVIGAGQASAEFAWTLRQNGFDGRITLLGRELYAPYERPPLSKRALVEDEDCLDRIMLRGMPAYEAARIAVRTGCEVSEIRLRDKHVVLADSGTVGFDACVLATGAAPRLPNLPGSTLGGVHVLRSYDDARRLRDALKSSLRLVVVGAGYLGLEAAASARMRGAQVTVIESAPRLMARSASETLSRRLQQRHHQAGVEFHLGEGILSLNGNVRVESVTTSSGSIIGADAVLFAIGAIPETQLAVEAGIDCSQGILTDARGRTSSEGIYAIGDCSAQCHPLYPQKIIRPESVQSALFQARCAAADLVGKPLPSAKYPTFWSHQYEFSIQIAGMIEHGEPTRDLVVEEGRADEAFSVRRYQGELLAAVECVNAPLPFIRAQTQLGKETYAQHQEGQQCLL
jgi:3-phenylpropionate/trans-cinnamate dioxygenase ferredoxin reductase subunit